MIIFGILLFLLLLVAEWLFFKRYYEDKEYFCSRAKVVYSDEKSCIVNLGERVENQFFRIEKPLKLDSSVIVIDLDKMNSAFITKNLFFILNQRRLKRMCVVNHFLDQALYSNQDKETKAVIGQRVSKFKSIAFDEKINKPILLYHAPSFANKGDTVSYEKMAFQVSLKVTELA